MASSSRTKTGESSCLCSSDLYSIGPWSRAHLISRSSFTTKTMVFFIILVLILLTAYHKVINLRITRCSEQRSTRAKTSRGPSGSWRRSRATSNGCLRSGRGWSKRDRGSRRRRQPSRVRSTSWTYEATESSEASEVASTHKPCACRPSPESTPESTAEITKVLVEAPRTTRGTRIMATGADFKHLIEF